ncbi:MAG: sulfatase [Planctomycetes bacterium]|nr:sulfatase [Planctomycetota bacterium]
MNHSSFHLVLLLTVGVASAPAAGAERLPNVVFFLVDDLGWRDLGCYGSDFYETPHVDRFAADSVRFTHAYAACHVCSPTRASILCGKYPARLGLTDWLPGRRDFPFQQLKNAATRQRLPFEETTLAEALREHGYATAHFGKWHLGEEPSGPLAHGFDVQIPRWNKGWPKAGYQAPFGLDGLEGAPGDYLTDRLTDEALNYIEEHQDRPFFLYLSHFAVHDPIQGRRDLVARFQAKLDRSPRPVGEPFILEGNPDRKNPLSKEALNALLQDPEYQGHRLLPQRTVKIKQRQDNTEFAAMIASMDEGFGRVLAKLEELGLAQHTIVIFYSDNGGMSAANFGRPDRVVSPSQLDAAYSTSNLPLRGGKGWLYEGGIRVPLLVKWPGPGKRGAVCDTPVISTDFYPSLLEMIGVAARPEQHADGASFAALLKGEQEQYREALYWHFPHYSNHGRQSPGGAIRCGDYKLLEYFERGTVQLFHLTTDPGEQHDLAREEPETATRLRAMLHRWRETIAAPMPAPKPAADSDAGVRTRQRSRLGRRRQP